MIPKDWTIKPFKQEHADEIVSYGMNHKLMETDASYKDNRICLADKGNAYTLFLNNKPVVAGGIFILWSGVAEGWVLANKNIFEIKFLAAKEIKIRTDELCKKNKIKRLQTSVKADFKPGIRFANWLGLKTEGLMKSYGPDGTDYYRMARIY
jgi:hypothetical protein|tara:strand:- start:206 stop:661 length:456 start_codon:yes stop_codon:yes gene_type:complete